MDRQTNILDKEFRRMDQIIREAIELHPDIMNKEDGFSLSRLWKPLICRMKAGVVKSIVCTSTQPSSAHGPYNGIPL